VSGTIAIKLTKTRVPVHCDPKGRQYKFGFYRGFRVERPWMILFSPHRSSVLGTPDNKYKKVKEIDLMNLYFFDNGF
jgi:hypothetical protein